jgi:multidrug efflux pump subunit AcrA (membrane-fusion protein)
MRLRTLLTALAAAGAAAGLAAGAYTTRAAWRPWVEAKLRRTPAADDAPPAHTHAHADRVTLSPQARANLRLVVEPIAAGSHWKTIQVPGVVVDRPGQSDRGVSAPVAAVVAAVHAHPGDTVRAGDPLFTLRLVSELIQNAQAELFKTTRDLEINRELLGRLTSAGGTQVVPEARLIEYQTQERRLTASILAYRQELLTRGLTPAQIDAAAGGRFVTEITVLAPAPDRGGEALVASAAGVSAAEPLAWEIKELRVQLGEQVQAGQVLSLLANHQALYVEGRGFKQEAALLERAAQNGWPVQAAFAEDEAAAWPPLHQTLQIRHLANTVDPVSRTFAFYLSLANQSRTYERDGRTFLVWRFRPGQRVRLKVPVEELKNVIVLPADAVVRDGAEVYAFRQNGDDFERKPVHLVEQDRDSAVLANDGSLGPGQYVARNAAAALQRILKAQATGGEEGHGHGHDHHGHSHDH